MDIKIRTERRKIKELEAYERLMKKVSSLKACEGGLREVFEIENEEKFYF